MSEPSRRPCLATRVRTRRDLYLTSCLRVGVIVCLAAGLLAAAHTPASAEPAAHTLGNRAAFRLLARDLGIHTAATHAPRLLQGNRVKARNGRAGGAGGGRGTHTHGTDTRGGHGSANDRDLALAATWQIDPALLEPQPGDSSATLDARAELAAVADRLHIVLDRYQNAHEAAEDAAAAAAEARDEQRQARADAALAHRVYVRDHRLLVQLVTTSYEEPPVTSMQIFLSAHDAHDMLVVMGTMQQLGSNQASVVTEAAAATVKMRESAALAHRAADAAKVADQKAEAALGEATDAGQEVLHQLDKARHALTLSVLADQMQTSLAHAMEYAKQLKRGSVSFPLPVHSGFYDNHNWGEHSAHWASIHTGDDYSVACGTPVLAATAGRIRILTDQTWAGPWLVMVSTGAGRLTTWYAHMGALAVAPGQHVKPGQVIGAVGDEGNATGCHLHFELHPDGGSIYQDTTDPDPWLKAVGVYPGS